MAVDRRRYGRAHRVARMQYLALYQPGVTRCALGGEMLLATPRMLDLAHDQSGFGYLGLACRRHNRGFGQAETNRERAAAVDPPPRGRTKW